jgi:hypothetical protein
LTLARASVKQEGRWTTRGAVSIGVNPQARVDEPASDHDPVYEHLNGDAASTRGA